MDIDCLFSSTCNPNSEESVSPIAIPGIIGSAFLRTTVYTGGAGTPTAGLYGYLYCLDLRGCEVDESKAPCFTNVVRCTTNQVDCFTNVVVCQTNVTMTNVMICLTNRLPATNIVCCITNRIAATNAWQCFPTHWGDHFCCGGVFPQTNIVTCVTNHIPARNVLICQPAFGWVTNTSYCVTNVVPGKSNVITCVTNRVPCPGTGPCVRSLSINFGPVVSTLDFDNDNIPDRGFLLTEGFGSVVPSSVTWSNGVVTIHFDPPICPGETSFCVGLVSSNAPCDVSASVRLTSGTHIGFTTRGPCPDDGGDPIDCDFSALLHAVKNLSLSEIIGVHHNQKVSRKQTLIAAVEAAIAAAEAGNLDAVLEALGTLLSRIDGGKNDWVTSAAARRIKNILNPLLECLENGTHEPPDDEGPAPNPSIDLNNNVQSCSHGTVNGAIQIANTTGDGFVEVASVRVTIYWQPGGGDWHIANPQSFTSTVTAGTRIGTGQSISYPYSATFAAPDEAREFRSVVEVTLVNRDMIFHDIQSFTCSGTGH